MFGSVMASEGGHCFSYSGFTMLKRRRLLRFKDAKPCCRGAACNQCADLLVEGPAFARATSALLGHTWAAKF